MGDHLLTSGRVKEQSVKLALTFTCPFSLRLDGTTHITVDCVSSLLCEAFSETPSQTQPEVCLLGESRPCLVDNDHEASQMVVSQNSSETG